MRQPRDGRLRRLRIGSWASTYAPVLFIVVVCGAFTGAAASFAFTGDPVPDDVAGEPQPVSSAEEVGSGPTVGGIPWRVIAFDSTEGLCFEVEGVISGNLGGGGCGFDLDFDGSAGGADVDASNVAAVSVNWEGFAQPPIRVEQGAIHRVVPNPGTTVVYGPAANDVVEVCIDLNLTQRCTPTVGLKSAPIRGYAVAFPVDAEPESVIATTASGERIEQRVE